MLTMGIDSGSAMTKAVLFDGQEIVDFRMEPSGSTPGRVIHRLYEELRTPDTAFVVATGYGRALLPEADKSITEITCHGAGAAFLCPGCDTVIDIGGQDSKVILLDPSGGQVKDFLMNDKCAAGTGRFLEMTMSRVGSDIASIDTFVEGAEPVTINSMCAVFAESEIIGLLAQETPPGSIALGCIYSICRRTAIFAQKLAPEHPKVFFSGGLAQSQVVREVLARYPGVTHLRCRLETGRTHQIRVHLAYIGHPILGDTVYGNKKPVPGLTGQCLHATGLRFLHPRTGRPVELTCPRPEEFERMLTKLQKRT